MSKLTTQEIIVLSREWSIGQAKYGSLNTDDALALVAEFAEWIEPADEKLEILSLEERQ